MSSAIGIKGQPSRFAVLRQDLDSDDEIELNAKSGVQLNFKGSNKGKKSESVALKNAKKRARKKKNQSRGSQHEEVHEVEKKCSGLHEFSVKMLNIE